MKLFSFVIVQFILGCDAFLHPNSLIGLRIAKNQATLPVVDVSLRGFNVNPSSPVFKCKSSLRRSIRGAVNIRKRVHTFIASKDITKRFKQSLPFALFFAWPLAALASSTPSSSSSNIWAAPILFWTSPVPAVLFFVAHLLALVYLIRKRISLKTQLNELLKMNLAAQTSTSTSISATSGVSSSGVGGADISSLGSKLDKLTASLESAMKEITVIKQQQDKLTTSVGEIKQQHDSLSSSVSEVNQSVQNKLGSGGGGGSGGGIFGRGGDGAGASGEAAAVDAISTDLRSVLANLQELKSAQEGLKAQQSELYLKVASDGAGGVGSSAASTATSMSSLNGQEGSDSGSGVTIGDVMRELDLIKSQTSASALETKLTKALTTATATASQGGSSLWGKGASRAAAAAAADKRAKEGASASADQLSADALDAVLGELLEIKDHFGVGKAKRTVKVYSADPYAYPKP